jgi:hypothetical protein
LLVASYLGTQLAVLKVTVAISAVDAAAAVQEAWDANERLVTGPTDPTDPLQPGLAIVAAADNQVSFRGVLDRLDGFMKLANVAAEVRSYYPSISTTTNLILCDVDPSMGQTRMGSCFSCAHSK